MRIMLNGKPPRDLSTLDFSDITSVPVVGYPTDDEGSYIIEFASDLDPIAMARVQMRALATSTEQTIQDKMFQALVANKAYLGIATPTNAQLVAQVNRLTRECNALIRAALSVYDSTDGV